MQSQQCEEYYNIPAKSSFVDLNSKFSDRKLSDSQGPGATLRWMF